MTALSCSRADAHYFSSSQPAFAFPDRLGQFVEERLDPDHAEFEHLPDRNTGD